MKRGILGYGIPMAFAVVCALVLAGCSSTRLVHSWEDEAFASRPVKKILVLGVFSEDVKRRVYEDGLAEALEAAGVSARTGYTLMPDVKDYDEEAEVREAVEATGVDGVMIARLKGVEKQERGLSTGLHGGGYDRQP